MKLKKRKRLIPFERLLRRIFSLTIIVILTLSGFSYYYLLSKNIIETSQATLKYVAISAQYIIDGDAHERITSVNSKEYIEMCDMLSKYKDEVGVYDVYTMIKNEDESFTRFVLASYEPNTTFLGPYMYTDKMKEAFEGKVSVTDEPFVDDFGNFYAAYSPLYNSKGEIIGIIGVDMSVDQINHVKQQLVKQNLYFLIIFLMLSSILACFISNKISKSYLGIAKKINKIKNGDMAIENSEEPINIMEIAQLDEAFDDMVKEINFLITILRNNSEELEEKASDILEHINRANTSNQIISCAIEQMYDEHEVCSNDINTSLDDISVCNNNFNYSIEKLKDIVNSTEETQIILEQMEKNISKSEFALRNINNKNEKVLEKALTENKEIFNKIKNSYVLLLEKLNRQLNELITVSEQKDLIYQKTKSISDNMENITYADRHIFEVLENQIYDIEDITENVRQLENMVQNLNDILENINTFNDKTRCCLK